MSDNKRKDDSFLRTVIAGLLIALAVETGTGLFYYGKIIDRVDKLELTVEGTYGLNTTINNMNTTLIELNANVTNLTSIIYENSKVLKKVASEQAKRTTIVYDAKDHMKNRNIHSK